MDREYILKVSGISKNFMLPLAFGKLAGPDFKPRKPTQALEDISFHLKRGKILAVLGPNGAGKTTLLKIIATLILPNKGTISLYPLRSNLPGQDAVSLQWPSRGVDSSACQEKIKSSLGLVAEEERSFYWRLSGRQNLEFFATLYGLDRRTIKTRIDELLELFQVDYADKRFDTYSTGMKRRLALIRGLLHNPELLLLDEPTKSLDYTTALNLRNFIKKNLVKAEGKSVILTTHHLDEALDFADLFMLLQRGKLFALGTLDELREKINNPRATLAEVFLKSTQEELY